MEAEDEIRHQLANATVSCKGYLAVRMKRYQPLQYIEDKPFWQSSKFVKRPFGM